MDGRVKSTFKFIFTTLFIDLLAFTFILPLLPKILDHYSRSDQDGAYKLVNDNLKVLQNILGVPESHNKVLLAGIIGSWFSLLQFISSPFLGALSDRYGRKPILLMAMTGTFLSYIVWFMASDSFALFILSRTIGGLCKANVGLSLAIVTDVSDDETRGKGMAVVGTSFSLAFIIGPSISAYLSTFANSNQYNLILLNPSMSASFLSLINIVLVLVFLEETNIIKDKGTHKSSNCEKKNTILKASHYVNPKSIFSFSQVKCNTQEEFDILRKSGWIYFYYLLFYSGLEFTLSFLTHIRFGFTPMDQGKLYLFSGLLMATIQGGYIRRIKGGKEGLIALVGLALIVPSFVMMGMSTSVGQVYFSLVFYALSSAIVVPCMTTIVSSHSPVKYTGATMGNLRSIGALARAVGPCLASLIFWTFGPVICYTGGAIALLIPLYMMGKLYKSNFKSSSPSGKRKVPDNVTKKIAKAN